MKATDFAFWLQGYFEINGSDSSLSAAQASLVLQKAEGVKAGADNVEQKAQAFVSYTQGMLFPVSHGITDAAFLKTVTADLKQKLNDLFVHAIDPTITGDQKGLHKIHTPKRNHGDDQRDMLC